MERAPQEGYWGQTPISLRCIRTAPAGRAEGAANLGSDPENARSRISSANQTSTHFAVFRCRSVAAAGDLLFFASPKKPKEKKGDPGVCVPPLRCGQPQGFCRTGSGSGWDSKAVSCQSIAIIFIAAYAHIDWARGLNGFINRPFEDCCKQETRDDRFRCCIYASTLSVCAEERRARRIRARACLSRRRVCTRPRLGRAPQVARSEAKGRRHQGRLSFAYFSLAKQRKVSRPPRRQSGTGTLQSARSINQQKKFGIGRFRGQSTNFLRLRLTLRVLRRKIVTPKTRPAPKPNSKPAFQ